MYLRRGPGVTGWPAPVQYSSQHVWVPGVAPAISQFGIDSLFPEGVQSVVMGPLTTKRQIPESSLILRGFMFVPDPRKRLRAYRFTLGIGASLPP